jgi:Flp pilus assembly protein TadD
MPKVSHAIMIRRLTVNVAAVLLVSSLSAAPDAATVQEPAGETTGPAAGLLKQAQQKVREGQLEEALALDRQAAAMEPASFPVESQTGAVLDLLGRYADARQHLGKAIDLAGSPAEKARGLRSMAVSYGFESDCAGAARYEARAYQVYLDEKDFYDAGEAADELARLCIESGDLDAAAKWYRTGHDAGLQEPDITPARQDLWAFRWEHAQARIAARRGDKVEAARHVAAAEAILDRGTNPDQKAFLPYLTGYVAFYDGDYRTALADLSQANQNDPFILCLLGQTYEKLGEPSHARESYEKALTRAVAHNPPSAYARPLAEKKLR